MDFDGDGSSDAQEYWAGTSPVDPADQLIFGISTLGQSNIAITWNSVIDRDYSVLWSPDLAQWNLMPDTYPGTGATMQVEFRMPFQELEPVVFFRLTPRAD